MKWPFFRRLRKLRKQNAKKALRVIPRVEALETRLVPSGSPVGSEFQVNTYTPLNQRTNPLGTVALDANGDFVVVWESRNQDGNNYGIYAQRFNSAGQVQGVEFQVNSYTTDRQISPAVAMDAAGDFVVTWESYNQDGSMYGIYAQRYNASGATVGGEFQVNPYTTSQQRVPSVAMDSVGNFVIVWSSKNEDLSGAGIFGQRYNTAGATVGGEFKANTYTTADQVNPSVAMDPAGDFVVVWQSYAQDGSLYGVYGQRFNAAGAPLGNEFKANSYTTSDQRNPAVALDTQGDFVIVWESKYQDLSNNGIYGQRYNASGAPQGNEFQINTYTTGEQRLPTVALTANGDFMAAWQSANEDGSGYGVYGRRYNAAGVAQTGEFLVNTTMADDQALPSVAADGAGDFVIDWESREQDGSGFGVFAQRYAANAPPTTAGVPNVTVNEDAPDTLINLRNYFNDFEDGASGLAYSISSITGTAGLFGSTTINNSTGVLTLHYTADTSGSANVTIRATDTGGKFVESTFLVTVNFVNDAPTLSGLTSQTVAASAGPQIVNLAGITSGSPNENQVLTVTAVSSNTSIVPNPSVSYTSAASTGSITYTPIASASGIVTITVTVTDNGGTANGGINSTSQTFQVTVTAVNSAPVACNDSYSITSSSTLLISSPGVLANDSDVDTGQTLTAQLVTGPSHGTLTLTSNGSFTYTPVINFRGSDSFTYRANDGSLSSSTATVLLTVTDRPPTAANDSYSFIGGSLSGGGTPNVLGNDSDPEGDALTAQLSSGPAHGNLILNVNGTFLYTPSAGFSGTDSFTYLANDGTLNSNAANVQLNVSATVNTPPVANRDSYGVSENSLLSVTSPGVLANDTDSDSPGITALVATGPAHGSLTLTANGSFTYLPAVNFVGSDSFTYLANDGALNSGTATVVIAINSVNQKPAANNDSYTFTEDITLSVASPGVLGNDSDSDSPTITALLAGGPAHGILVLNGNGSFTYTPVLFFSGTDSFTYFANDGSLNSSPATVTLIVTPLNHAPFANNDNYTITEDTSLAVAAPGILGNDSDIENSTLRAFYAGGGPNHGTLSFNTDGSVTYVPDPNFNGTDSLLYRANDGSLNSSIATVWFTVLPVNDPPVASNDLYRLNEDATLAVVAGGVLGNDTDVDVGTGQPQTLTALLVSGVGHGTLALQGNGAFTYQGSASFNGTDSFSYKVDDGGTGAHLSNTATVTLIVNAINDPPVANNDSYTATEDVQLSVASSAGVLANDTDLDPGTGQPETLTALLVSGASHGTLTLQGNGAFTYQGNANFNGTDSFTYRVDDGGLGLHFSNTATVTIVVNAVNDPPVANNDAYSVDEDTTLTVGAAGVLSNDTDVDPGTGQPQTLTALLVSGAGHGTVALQGTGAFTYQGSANFNGTDSFTYQIDDGGIGAHLSNAATVTIVVNAVNDAPLANNDSFSVNEDALLSVGTAGVMGNDTDVDPGTGQVETLSTILINTTTHGTLALQGNGAFTYQGNTNFNGTDSFTYKVDDGGTGAHVSNTATVTIVVNAVNDAPVANNDSYSVNAGTTLVIGLATGVLANDTDVDPATGQPQTLTAILASTVTHGTLTLGSSGSFTYTPTATFNGTDSFTYRASDGSLTSNTATVAITVNAANHVPVANSDSYTLLEDNTLAVSSPGLLANDTDADGDIVTVLLGSSPGHGTVSLSGSGAFTYTPSALFHGTDRFTYSLNDGLASSGPATVTMVVAPVNHAPVANNDSYITQENQSLNVTAAGLLANDLDVDGDPKVALYGGSGPSHGSLSIQPDGSFSYVPNLNFIGTDSFVYRANDGQVNSNLATVTITVRTVDRPPRAVNTTFSVFENQPLSTLAPGVLAGASDPDNDVITAILGAGPSHGTLSLAANGSFNYMPNLYFHGTDNFTYQANDGFLNSALSTATITVIAVNQAPAAGNDLYSVFENLSVGITAPGVLNNDTDVDNPTITALLASGPSQGTLSFHGDGSFTYSPNANYNGPDSFTYKANDGLLSSNEATVSIIVIPVDQPPVAVNDVYSVFENQALSVTGAGVLGNDNDIDSSTLTALLMAAPAHGSLTLNANGSLLYTPATYFNGTDSFAYAANDGMLGSSPATVIITVIPVDQPPAAVNDTYSVFQGFSMHVNALGVLNNDSDIDSATLTTLVASGPKHGSLTFNSNGAFTYLPAASYSGPDSFTYTANDGLLNSSAATVSITVIPVNHPPVAVKDSFNVFENSPLIVLAPAGLLKNDTDADGRPLTALLVTSSVHGTVALNADGSFSYQPSANYNGTDSFRYRANDGVLNSAAATATIVVIPVNQPPVAGNDSYSLQQEGLLIVGGSGVLSNDNDVDSPTLTAVLAGSPAHGTLTLNANGSFQYTPIAGFAGSDSFRYRANDGMLNSGAATVTLTVTPVNHAPLANGDAYTFSETGVLPGAAPGVLANDTDVDGQALTTQLLTSPVNGTLTLNANGAFTYTPNAGFFGADSFTYRASDGSLTSGPVNVTLKVMDVSGLVSALSSGLVGSGGILSGTILITNTSQTTIAGPLQVVLTGLTPGVTLANLTGATSSGNPYITIPTTSLPSGVLTRGQSITVNVNFNDPLLTPVLYLTKVLAGAF